MKAPAARIVRLLRGPRGAALAALALAGLVMLFAATEAHDRLELVLYDLRFQLRPKAEPLPELVLLNVDDASVSAVGVYPWPRYYYAYALRRLAEAGLASLVFDFQFMDSSPPFLQLDNFQAAYETVASGGALGADELLSVMIDNDGDLAAASAEFGGTVMPFSFAKVESKQELSPESEALRDAAIARFTGLASLPVPAGDEIRFAALAEADRVAINYPIPELMMASGAFGFVDNDADLDGSHRRVRLARVFDGRIYFHLGLVAFLRMCGSGLDDLSVEPGRAIVIRDALHPASGVVRDIEIPVDESCAVFFDWIGDFERTARYVPAHALFEYPLYADQFELQLMLKDMASGDGSRVALADELDALRAAIEAEPDRAARYGLLRAWRMKFVEYERLIGRYLDEAANELAALEAARAAGREVDEEALASLRDFSVAIRTTMAVKGLYGSVAVMGLTATGTQDEGVTPLSNNYWMVGSYPTLVNTLARGRFIREVPDWIERAAVVVLALGLALAIQAGSARASYLAVALALAIVNAGVVAAFGYADLWIDQVSLNLAMLLPSVVVIIAKFAGEEANRRFIQGAFSKYLSQDVIDRIIADPGALRLGGESCDITTFFSDIAGFSSISERLSAEGLVHLLNEYLSEMSDIIMDSRGTVDKYEGDAIMAFWGAPLAFPDHAAAACRAALRMQRRLAELRAAWKEQGRDELRVRMGLNTGPAVAGNMGSRTRMNYTVMGDSVNLASRLEGANKQYGTYLMVSDRTRKAAGEGFRFRELDTVRVVGKSEPITVYELLGEEGQALASSGASIGEGFLALLDRYERGLGLYKERRWGEARDAFAAALKADSADGPSRVYYGRCKAWAASPPPAAWDGVTSLSSK